VLKRESRHPSPGNNSRFKFVNYLPPVELFRVIAQLDGAMPVPEAKR
jgi:hypothetical protein